MHRPRILLVLLALATLTSSLSAQGASQPRYLALGDSITFGFIDNAGFEYVNAANFIGFPTYVGLGANMNVANAACPGETTASFLSSAGKDNGCSEFRALGAQLHVSYSSTQLDFALAFLESHPQTRLITVGLGGDDLLLLNTACASNLMCIQTGLATVTASMETILGDLRGTGFTGTMIVVNYYSTDYSDPIQTGIISLLNNALAVAAAQQGAVLADVFSAFRSATRGGSPCAFGLLNSTFSPTNQFTCDIHPSQSGQILIGKVVAQTFAGAKSEQ